MTPSSEGGGYENMVRVYCENAFLATLGATNMNISLRPVINVTTDNGFVSGDGTAQNPYILNAE